MLFLDTLPLHTPAVPLHTSEKPTVAPTIECVPEIGSRSAVANNNQIAEPAKLDSDPNISSCSCPSYKETSNIPLRIVSDTYQINQSLKFRASRLVLEIYYFSIVLEVPCIL